MTLEAFIKDPDSMLDYSVDWSDWLGADDIASVVWFVDDVEGGVAEGDSLFVEIAYCFFTDKVATVWLSQGVVRRSYDVTCRITTTSGRVDDRTFRVKINEK